MVVSEDSQGVPVDCSVGSIVWVRRRNGSWWPGRILGLNELSASHLMSPRSGTPVKLLGREDASVDWYNLEKSKRVKAFRCGEFDDCIGRAESSQGIPIKKREKYARREDAILHALELERQQLEQKQAQLGMTANCMDDKTTGVSGKQFSLENSLGKDDTRDQNYKFINLKSQTLSKRLDSSFEEDSMANLLHNQKIKQANKPGWEDDNSEARPRMRGLQDFGLKITPSKRKLSVTAAHESSRKSVLVENQVSGGKNSLAVKRKRSQGGPTEESLVKRRDRRRPLLQVLQSSAKLLACQPLQTAGDAVSNSMQGEEHMGVLCDTKGDKILSYDLPNDLEMDISQSQFGLENRVLHPVSMTEENACSALIEEEESDSSEGDFLNSEIEEERAMLSGSRNSRSFAGCHSFGFQARGQLVNMANEELDECGFSNYMSQFHPLEQSGGGVSADTSVSKWQLKGKRNIRNLTKKPMEVMDGNKCNGSRHEASWETKRTMIKTMRTGISSQRPSGQGFPHRNARELNYAYDQGDLIEKDFAETDRVGFGSRRYQLTSKSYFRDRGRKGDCIMDSDDDSRAISLSEVDRFSNFPSSLNSEGCRLSQASLRGYWEESNEGFDPVRFYQSDYREADRNMMEYMLVDVDLKVQATYQGERVPLVSLMSRLNGKAIVGHPVQIEVLDDGSTDLLLSSNDCREEPDDKNGSSGLPPVWCTARRTVMQRIPRAQPSSPPEDEDWEPNQHAVIECSRPPLKKPYANHLNHRLRLVKKSFSHICRPMMEKKLSRKILKKASLLKKTRMLSSIAIDQKPGGKSSNSELGSKKSCYSDLLVKTQKTAPITCVPVKLVFSRILEAVCEPQPKPS